MMIVCAAGDFLALRSTLLRRTTSKVNRLELIRTSTRDLRQQHSHENQTFSTIFGLKLHFIVNLSSV